MTIAITSQGKDLQSPLDPRFGRAKYFILLETATGAFSVADNSANVNATQGAGIQAARCVVERGAEVLITGHVGPKAFAALSAANVRVFSATEGIISDLIEDYEAGLLTQASGADV